MAGAAFASAVHALDLLSGLQLVLRHPTYTKAPKICVLGLNTPQATQVLIPGLLPFGYEQAISDPFIKAPLIEFL